MWFIIIGAVVIIIGIIVCLSADGDQEQVGAGCFVVAMGMLVVIIPSSLVTYHRGLPVALDNIPYSMSKGTIYTVVETTTNYAVLIDGTQTSYVYDGGEAEDAWLVRLTQTNLVAGRQYMIAKVPDGKNGSSTILVEAKK